MSYVDHCKKHGQYHGEICGECFEDLKAENSRLRAALMSIGIAEGCENYPEELRAAILMDKARIALIGE